MQKKFTMKKLLFNFFKKILLHIYPKPRGLRIYGSSSLVMMPRRIKGAGYVRVGQDVIVQPFGWIAAFDRWGSTCYSPTIEIGDHVRIGRHVVITAVDRIYIGDGCLFSEQVFVSDHTHQALPSVIPPAHQPLILTGPVYIGRHCFIGIRVCIMGGVTLGDYCVVGANSVVTRSFPAGSVIAGTPARLLQTLPIDKFILDTN